MNAKSYKEITPIFYGENLIKVINYHKFETGEICFAAHYHERMELLRIHRGQMRLVVDGEAFTAEPNELVIIGPNQSHAGVSGIAGLDYDVIMFDLANLNNNSFAYRKYIEPILQQKIGFAAKTTHAAILAAADSLVSACAAQQKAHPLHTIGMVYSLLGAFYQHASPTARTAETRTGLNAITAYINEHFTEPLSTRSLSETFGYNETYFSRMFKKNTGETVMQYIAALRLQRAQQLLRDTDDSVRTVALKCGYTDVFYFSDRFKRRVGKAPRDYRADCRRHTH